MFFEFQYGLSHSYQKQRWKKTYFGRKFGKSKKKREKKVKLKKKIQFGELLHPSCRPATNAWPPLSASSASATFSATSFRLWVEHLASTRARSTTFCTPSTGCSTASTCLCTPPETSSTGTEFTYFTLLLTICLTGLCSGLLKYL
jgi:hypothetical protein